MPEHRLHFASNMLPGPSGSDGSSALRQITTTAQGILDARARYLSPDAGGAARAPATLADLYDDTFMPSGLRKAHQDNDRAPIRSAGSGPVAEPSARGGRLNG